MIVMNAIAAIKMITQVNVKRVKDVEDRDQEIAINAKNLDLNAVQIVTVQEDLVENVNENAVEKKSLKTVKNVTDREDPDPDPDQASVKEDMLKKKSRHVVKSVMNQEKINSHVVTRSSVRLIKVMIKMLNNADNAGSV